MKNNKHLSIIKHYEACFKKYGDNHLGVDWPNESDALKRYKVMAELIVNENKTISLLDFGCGLSHFYNYLKNNNQTNIKYHGLDISKEMIDYSKRKYPENTYYCQDILTDDLTNKYDYIILNGVFTEKLKLSHSEMFQYFKEMINMLFPKMTIGLAFNVMSKHVDWEREDLFHLPLDDLASFLSKEITRNFVIRNDYGLFEYTTYVYK